MAKNDEGEFELILGNKQLLSVFFIVVVLLGVFFTMGYIVGRNTATEAATQLASAPGQPLVVESDRPNQPPPEPDVRASTETPPPEPAVEEPVRRLPPEPKPAPVRPPVREQPKPTPPPPPVVSSSGVSDPPSGTTWLQVAATSQPEGEVLRDVLAKRGFTCHLAPVPGQDLVRVLVGPLSGGTELSDTRSKLQAAGFKPFARSY